MFTNWSNSCREAHGRPHSALAERRYESLEAVTVLCRSGVALAFYFGTLQILQTESMFVKRRCNFSIFHVEVSASN